MTNLKVPGVLVTTGNHQLACMIGTNLARHGIRAEAVSDSNATPTRFSGGFTKFHNVASVQSWEEYTYAILRICEQRNLNLLLPSGRDVFGFAPFKALIDAKVTYPFADAPTCDKLDNKLALSQLAERLGVDTPASTLVRTGSPLPDVKYPVVHKPLDGFGGKGFGVARNREELAAGLESGAATNWIVQPFIAGDLIAWMGIRWQGRLRASCSFEISRTNPAPGGYSVFRRCVHLPEVDRLVLQLLEAAEYEGLSAFDFMRCRTTGRYYLIDCNPRFATSLHLALSAGVDLPVILWKLASGQNPGEVVGRPGAISLSLTGHLSRFLGALGQPRLALRTGLELLSILPKLHHGESFYCRKPFPFFPLVFDWAAAHFRSAPDWAALPTHPMAEDSGPETVLHSSTWPPDPPVATPRQRVP